MYRDPGVALTNNGARLEQRIGALPQHSGGHDEDQDGERAVRWPPLESRFAALGPARLPMTPPLMNSAASSQSMRPG